MNTALISPDATIIVAFSGGPDSVYLLHQLVLLKRAGRVKEIIAAHLDHEWRAESGNDARLCAAIAQKYGVIFISKKISELKLAAKWNGSQEEIGRKARQFFLMSVMRNYDADAIALGHHADDQEETFFIRLLRGTSLTGLCGMTPKSGPYIRPLLELSKKTIVDFLDQHKIPYLIDPTNQSLDYLRNRLRLKVLPALRACDERFDHALLSTMKRLQQTEEFLQALTHERFAAMSREIDGTLYLDGRLFAQEPAVMQQRLLMRWLTSAGVSFTPTEQFLQEITRFLLQPTGGNHKMGSDWSIAKKKNWATISKS